MHYAATVVDVVVAVVDTDVITHVVDNPAVTVVGVVATASAGGRSCLR